MTQRAPKPRVLLSTALATLLALTALSGCGSIEHPSCENDAHCQSQGEFCVAGLCKMCREDNHCGDPRVMACNAGACERIAGSCLAANDCPSGQLCRDNRCQHACLADEQCGDRQICHQNQCVDVACVADSECAAGQTCEANRCVAGACQMATVYFDFDEHQLRADASEDLRENQVCFESMSRANAGAVLGITGHADERGTEEYNMALGERRARLIQKTLSRLGVREAQLRAGSRGEYEPAVPRATSEAQHQRNRRAEFQVR